MKWAWHVARRENAELHEMFWREYLREIDHLEELGVEGWIILKWVFEKWDRETWTGLICHRVRSGEGACQCVTEISDSIKCGCLLDKL
jgi:hypothetical protein